MFLLVSVRHVGAHPGEHQHGVSVQISITLGRTFLRTSRIRNIPLPWILARVFVYVPPFISQILDFIYWTVLIFILIYSEWRDTENQHDQKLGRVDFWDCYYGQREKWPIADRCFPSSLRSRRLEVVGTRKNGRARRRHARGEVSRVSLACARSLFRPLFPIAWKRDWRLVISGVHGTII